MNPKGFFELPSQNIFLRVAYPGIHGEISDPPSLDLLDKKGKTHAKSYLDYINHEFNGEYPIAVKSQRMLTLPFLYEWKNKIDVRVILLDRNMDDQIASLKRVWERSGTRQDMSYSDIRSFITSWKNFRDRVVEHYDFPVCKVKFNQLIQDPYKTTKRLTRFLNVACPPEQEVREWIDPSLANRDRLKSIRSRSMTLTQRVCRKVGALLIEYSKPNL